MSEARYSARKAYFIWAVATAAYIVAIVHRTSLGLTGLEAAQRFGASAAELSLFTVVQLCVYAAAQIPVGIALDKIGARKLIALGALMMAVGQFGMAFADSIPLALAARVLIGAGDATTFVSVLKLVAVWFPPSKAPLLSQLTGQIAQTGQIISAVPFVIVVNNLGWSQAYTILGIVGVFASLWTLAWVRDFPEVGPLGTATRPPRPIDVVPHRVDISPLRGAMSTSGSWLGFWTHLITAFSFNVFIFLWGTPFLRLGHDLSQAQVSLVITCMTLVGMVSGPLIGMFCARHPLRRSWLVYAIVAGVVCAWLVMLLPTQPLPLWVLIVSCTMIAVGGPASLIGLDFARTSNPTAQLGVGSGIANMGGFVGGFLCILAVGVVLDRLRPSGQYELADFRTAFSVMLVPLAVGLVGFVVTKKNTREDYRERGIVVPPVREAWKTYRKK